MTEYPTCTKCSTPLPLENVNGTSLNPCPGCGSPVRAEIFPAFFRELSAGSAGEALVISSEASCFYHPQKKAAVVCSECGRFLCGLCDVDLDGVHFCPSCLEASQKKGKIATIENQRELHDSKVFQIALLPMFAGPLTLVTSPVALYLGFKHWNSPRSLVHRSRWRFVVGMIFATIQFLFWTGLFVYWLVR